MKFFCTQRRILHELTGDSAAVISDFLCVSHVQCFRYQPSRERETHAVNKFARSCFIIWWLVVARLSSSLPPQGGLIIGAHQRRSCVQVGESAKGVGGGAPGSNSSPGNIDTKPVSFSYGDLQTNVGFSLFPRTVSHSCLSDVASTHGIVTQPCMHPSKHAEAEPTEARPERIQAVLYMTTSPSDCISCNAQSCST